MVEKSKEYIQAARVIGISPSGIMRAAPAAQRAGPGAGAGDDQHRDRDHHRGDAVVPRAWACPDQPSLGTLIRVGNDFLFSGEWWIAIFPGAALVIMVLAINLLGDWMRDALNPKLR